MLGHRCNTSNPVVQSIQCRTSILHFIIYFVDLVQTLLLSHGLLVSFRKNTGVHWVRPAVVRWPAVFGRTPPLPPQPPPTRSLLQPPPHTLALLRLVSLHIQLFRLLEGNVPTSWLDLIILIDHNLLHALVCTLTIRYCVILYYNDQY